MSVLENNMFVQDRLERNAEDFQGCGVGEGRYDAGKERAEKIREIMLPIVILLFMGIYWAVIIHITYVEVKHVLTSEKYVADAKEYEGTVSIKLPIGSGWQKKVVVDSALVHDGKVTVYYNAEDNTYYVPYAKGWWILFYAFGAVITFIMLYWMKKIVFNKKHAIEKERKHSYKDY